MSGKKIDKHFILDRWIQVDPIHETGEPRFRYKEGPGPLGADKAKNT